MAEQDFKPIAFSTDSVLDQSQSSFFSILPGEIRDHIWAYALADYEDKTEIYDDATCYKRPEYLAPRRTETQLLRTCKRVYQEAWFLPWANAEHAFYLTHPARAPPRTISVRDMQKALNALAASHVEPNIEHVRVFAQLYMLENGEKLSQILKMQHFNPKTMTITIRHTDWWFWESDSRLHIGAHWVHSCRFPDALTELCVAFESLERKKGQIDEVAAQAMEKWQFKRKDGTIMSAANCTPKTMRWTGKSTWNGTRWLRDETRPNQVDYYVSTVTWRPVRQTAEASESSTLVFGRRLSIDGPEVPRLETDWDSVSVGIMQRAHVPPDASADEVIGLLGGHPSSDTEDSEEESDEEEDSDGMDEDEDEEDSDY